MEERPRGLLGDPPGLWLQGPGQLTSDHLLFFCNRAQAQHTELESNSGSQIVTFYRGKSKMEENVEQTYSILGTYSCFSCAEADEINALRSLNASISATNSALGIVSADVECKWLMLSSCAAVPPVLPTLLTNELGVLELS